MFKASVIILIISIVLFICAAKVGWMLGIFGVGALIQITSFLALVPIVISVISIIKRLRIWHSIIIFLFAIALIIFMNMFACWHYDDDFRNNQILNKTFTIICYKK